MSNDSASNGHVTASTPKAPNWKGPQQNGGKATTNGDPFNVKSTKADHAAKLSGGAAAFMPGPVKPAPISFLNRDSTADDAEGPVIVSSDLPPPSKPDKGKGKAVQQPIGTRGANFSPTRPRAIFTTDVGPDVLVPGGHYIKIANAPVRQIDWTFDCLYRFVSCRFSRLFCCSSADSTQYDWQRTLQGSHTRVVADESKFVHVFLKFDDIRDAAAAFEQIHAVNTTWTPKYINQTEYAASQKEGNVGTLEKTSFHDGQVVFVAHFEGLTSDFSLDGLFDEVEKLAKSFGDVLAFAESDAEGNDWHFRAEYYKISEALGVIATTTKENPVSIEVSIHRHRTSLDVTDLRPQKWEIFAEALPDYTVQYNGHFLGNGVGGVITPSKMKSVPAGKDVGGSGDYASPTGRTAWRVDAGGQRIPAPPPKQLPKSEVGRMG